MSSPVILYDDLINLQLDMLSAFLFILASSGSYSNVWKSACTTYDLKI